MERAALFKDCLWAETGERLVEERIGFLPSFWSDWQRR